MLRMLEKMRRSNVRGDFLRSRISISPERVSRIFLISDIHGHLDLLEKAEAKIEAAMHHHSDPGLIVFLGDYVDRGPNSSGVIEHILSHPAEGLHRVCLCGNHDEFFWRFLREKKFDRFWLDFGGDRTLMSYGIDPHYYLKLDPSGRSLKRAAREHVPVIHQEFLESLPITISYGDYLFVHAGIVPGKPLEEQTDTDLMWIREPFLSRGPELGDLVVIHGHTPSKTIQYGSSRIGIDTGAYATGNLAVLMIGPEGISEL